MDQRLRPTAGRQYQKTSGRVQSLYNAGLYSLPQRALIRFPRSNNAITPFGLIIRSYCFHSLSKGMTESHAEAIIP